MNKIINGYRESLEGQLREFKETIDSFPLNGLNLTYVSGPEHRKALYDFCLREEERLLEKE
ncbi:MAG: hypothetical protein HEEMFOPI_00071 [Holosporales bacterium]